ncbi:MAG: 2-succinyl-6-hydroxy-2,4-cyclohexadiene-1-carboxylate synthase [Chlamydiales bacterium]|jgi:2-succinyl-6-hydroxy-2,4-cyclohexadiene-1-carboxylate synthase
MTTALRYHYKRIDTTPTFVFLHGFMGSKKDWEPLVNLLGNSYSSLVIDLPGHGDSQLESHKVYTMDGSARLVVDILDELEISQAVLVGYSMGGRLSLYLALYYPQYFTELALVSASPGFKELSDRHARRRRDQNLADKLESGNFEEFLDKWYDRPIFASLGLNPGRLEMIKDKRKHNDVRFLAKSLRFMGAGMQQSFWDELEKLSMPLCLIVGEKDEKFTRLADEMAKCYQKTRMIVVPNAGHNVHEENPKGLFDALTSTSGEPASVG